MKLLMTLLVRDEMDIVSANIDYHLSQGVDFVIATDNLSVDATPEILSEYERHGVLRYIRESSDDYSQSVWVTRMARLAYDEYGADWVINNDADEFWWPNHGGSLKNALQHVPAHFSGAQAERKDFPGWVVAQPEPFFEWMNVREVTSFNSLGHPLPPKVCHRGFAGVKVAQGNHAFAVNGEPGQVCEAPISIFHFPIRSYAQFENKIVKGGAAYKRNTRLPATSGATWRRLHREYEEGRLPEAFAKVALTEELAAERIRAGECVIDNRLRDHFASLI